MPRTKQTARRKPKPAGPTKIGKQEVRPPLPKRTANPKRPRPAASASASEYASAAVPTRGGEDTDNFIEHRAFEAAVNALERQLLAERPERALEYKNKANNDIFLVLYEYFLAKVRGAWDDMVSRAFNDELLSDPHFAQVAPREVASDGEPSGAEDTEEFDHGSLSA